MNATDHKYLTLLEQNNKLFERIAESLETIALHLLEQSKQPTPDNPQPQSPTIHKPVFTYAKNNPLHYLKTTEEATKFVNRCITMAKEQGERIVSIKNLSKLLRHEYNIPESQLLDITKHLETTFKICGLSPLSRFIYLIEDSPTTTQYTPTSDDTPSYHEATL